MVSIYVAVFCIRDTYIGALFSVTFGRAETGTCKGEYVKFFSIA